ncbi:hypothetical protein ACOSP7_028342 [Xanthoceras sorbifolium]
MLFSSLLLIVGKYCRDAGHRRQQQQQRLQRGLSLNIKKSPLTKRGVGTPLLALPKRTRLERFTHKDQHLLLRGSASNLPPLPLATVGGARGKGKRVDFDASVEQPIQRGISGPYTTVGLAAFSSLSWALGAVAKEYLEWALMIYEEFLTRSLSQRIEKAEVSNLHHTLVHHALLVSCVKISLFLYMYLLYLAVFSLCDTSSTTVNSSYATFLLSSSDKQV